MRRAALLAAAAPFIALNPLAAGAAGTAAAAGAAGAGQPTIPLLAPVHDVDPLNNAVSLGLRHDRLLTSVVPGPVRNSERVTAAIGASGAPLEVTDVQTLVITGAGAYIVRELGPARQAIGVGDTVPPVLELGQVVWQGFSPGTRTLRAVLTLDPGIEAQRLPMAVTLRFVDAHGRVRPLLAGARAPADGAVTMTLTNQTASPRTVALGTGQPATVAALLDRLYLAARHPAATVPPYAGGALPLGVPGRQHGAEQVTVVAPLRVTGTLGVAGSAGEPVDGPGTTPVPGGARVAGTLDGAAAFHVTMRAGERLVADLDARPWLDPRLLVPPGRSWRASLTSRSTPAELAAATTTLAEAAAAAARSAEYSPYLQADTHGSNVSSFRYVMAAPTATPRAGETLRAKPAAITAALLALLAIAGNAALLWRRL